MKKRVLILSTSVGTGHVRAAQALERAFTTDARVAAVKHADALDFTTAIFREFYSTLYMKLVRAAPDVLGWAYKASDEPWKGDDFRRQIDRLNTRPLVKMIREFDPQITVCTHFMPAGIIAHLIAKGELDTHHSIVVTDLDGSGCWHRSGGRHFPRQSRPNRPRRPSAAGLRIATQHGMHLSSSLLFWLLGFVLVLWGGVKVLVVAFGRSILWGLATLFVPFANLLFVCTHWKETKSGFLMGFGGCAMCLGIVLCNPEMRTEIRALAHLPFQRAAEDLTTEIEKKRAQIDEQNAAFATDGAQLSKEYAALETRRKALKPGNAEETAKFNADAAAYQARTTRRKEVDAGIEAAQHELDALLAQRSRVAVRSGGSAPQVVIYTMPECSACQMAKQHLAQKGVSYQEIDIEASRENREAFDRAGGTGLPLILIGKKRMEGFDAQWLDALL